MNESIQKKPNVSRPATAQEIELVEWAEDAYRKSLGTLTDSLKQLLILITAILAGSAALYNQIPASNGWKVIAVIFFQIALGVALAGNWPRDARIDRSCAQEIKAERDEAIKIKSRFFWVANLLLFCGFGVIVGGLLAKLF